MVDWFFRIGALIERICIPGKTITSGSTTVKVKDRVTSYASLTGIYGYTNGKPVYYVNSGSGVTQETDHYYRTIGVPSPFFITTAFSNLSTWNLGTAWALLSSILIKA